MESNVVNTAEDREAFVAGGAQIVGPSLYKSVDLDGVDQAKLRKLQASQNSLQQFMASFQQAGERRFAALQEETEAFFAEIAAKYNLDLTHVHYEANKSATQLVPTMVKLK
jgi:hypothetical protein